MRLIMGKRNLTATTVYLILSTVNSLAFALVFTVNLVYQATVVRLDPLQLVLVGTLLETTVFFFEIPTGVVADVYSRRLSVIIGTALIGAGFIVEGAFSTFVTVLAAQILWGIGATFISGATEAWIVDEIGDENLGQVLIRGSQFGKVGGIAGVFLSVALGSILINLPIAAGGLLFLALAVFLGMFMPENGFHAAPREERQTWQSMRRTFSQGLRQILRVRILVIAAAIGFCLGLYSEGYDRLWTPHVLNNIGLPQLGNFAPVVWFGIFNVVGMFTGIIADEIVRRRVNTEDERAILRAVLTITLSMVIALAVFAVAANLPLALVAMITFNTLRGAAAPLSSRWVNRHIPSDVRATVLSTFSQLDAFGQISGGPVVGVIGQQVGIRAALGACSIVLLPVVFLYARLIRVTAAHNANPQAQPELSQ